MALAPGSLEFGYVDKGSMGSYCLGSYLLDVRHA